MKNFQKRGKILISLIKVLIPSIPYLLPITSLYIVSRMKGDRMARVEYVG